MIIKEKGFDSLSDFVKFISSDLLDTNHMLVFRGQENADWQITSTFYRYWKELEEICHEHDLPANKAAPAILEVSLIRSFEENLKINNDLSHVTIENLKSIETMQIGQHFGLPSSLVDWTRSPYVALYFAIRHRQKNVENRAFWVLNCDVLRDMNSKIEREIWPKNEAYKQSFPKHELVDALRLDTNKRISFQQGIFTRERNATPIQQWADSTSVKLGETYRQPLLEKYFWPNDEKERFKAIGLLDLMNINERVLFPDIEGSVNDARYKSLKSIFRRNGISLDVDRIMPEGHGAKR